MNWQRQHGTLKLTNAYINAVLVETWRAFQISSDPIIINALNYKKILPLNPPDEDTNTQACLVAAQTPKGEKSEEIKVIARASISSEYVMVVRTTDPMVVLREKVNVGV